MSTRQKRIEALSQRFAEEGGARQPRNNNQRRRHQTKSHKIDADN